MFFIRPILNLGKHLGLTSSPHFPLSAGYITLPAYGKSLPLRLRCQHNLASTQINGPGPIYPCISNRLVVHRASLPPMNSGRTIRNIGNPELVGCIGCKIALYQIWSRPLSRTSYRCFSPLAAAYPLQVCCLHQASNAFASYRNAIFITQFGMDTRCTISASTPSMNCANLLGQHFVFLRSF